MSQADFVGNPLPLSRAVTECVTYRTIYFVTMSGNAGAKRCIDLCWPATKNLNHRLNSLAEQPISGASPAKMNNTGNMFFTIIKYNRIAIGDKNSDKDIALIGNDRVTLHPLEMRDFRIWLIDHQDSVAMHLFDSQ